MAVRYCIARKGGEAFTVSGKILTFCGQWRNRDRVFATRTVATCKRCRNAQHDAAMLELANKWAAEDAEARTNG